MVLKKAVEMAGYLHKEQPLPVLIEPVAENLELPLHPTVLRQIVLYIILRVLQSGFHGCLTIAAQDNGEILRVSFSAPDNRFVERIQVPDLLELLPALGSKAEIEVSADAWKLNLLFSRIARVKVLVIDDNLDQIYLYRKMLSLSNFELIHLFSGEDLLEHIAEHKPDLILMDILLPGIDGWDLLLQIRQNPTTASIPVIISSVMGNESMAKSLGAHGYLLKPVNHKAFLQMLTEVSRLHPAVQAD
jgi:CheY-like chemotaxis protein